MRMLGIVALILFVTGCVSVKSSKSGVEVKSFGFAKYNNNYTIGYFKIKEIGIEETHICSCDDAACDRVCVCHKK